MMSNDSWSVRRLGGRGADRPGGGPAHLVPIIARVVDLGRGPPGLVAWVHGRLDGGRPPGSAAREAVVHRLAVELAVTLGRAGAADTVAACQDLSARIGPG